MKSPALFCLVALSCLPALDLRADETVETTVSTEKEKVLLTAEQIDDLLAPIALYPDPLVAIILPAATFPADVVLAARYLKAEKDPEAIEDQPWDDSVKALARYPDVVKWMDENLAWTQQVGAAFLVQPAAVLTGTQRLRAAAIAAGNLKNSPEQTVVVEREVIRIVPAQREVIYVPVYDPLYVYRPRPIEVYYPGPLVTFSVGYRTGFWLSYYCNWGVNTVVIVNRPYRAAVWHSHPVWSCPTPVVYHHHVWRPAPVRVQAVCRDFERRPVHRVARPTANSYVQRGPERETSRSFTRSDNGDRRQNRPDTVSPANRNVTVADATEGGRRNRDDPRARPASNERTQIQAAPVGHNSSGPAQSGRQGADRRNSTAPAAPVLADRAEAVPASPPASGADRIRPSRASTVNTAAPTPAPFVHRQETVGRRDTRVTSPTASETSSAPARPGRGQGQNSARPSIGSAPSETNVSRNGTPVTTRSQPATTPARRPDSRMGSGSNSPVRPTASAPVESGQRRSSTMEPTRVSTPRPEATSPARIPSRQGRMANEPTAPSATSHDSEATTTGMRSRR